MPFGTTITARTRSRSSSARTGCSRSRAARPLAEPDFWAPQEREALERHAHGRALDIGCNAGRHALYLQQHGLEVLGVDTSPLAIAVAKERGLRSTEVLSIDELSSELGTFDTVLMLGNNFGLFANAAKTRRLLRRFRSFTRPGATLIAESLNVYETNDPDHLAYQAANRARGRMSGQIRLRAATSVSPRPGSTT